MISDMLLKRLDRLAPLKAEGLKFIQQFGVRWLLG
jgi:hypothetical protein